MIDRDLPFELHNALRRERANGEVIVWLEQPNPARFKIISGWIGVAFGVTVVVVGLYMITATATGKPGWSGGQEYMPAAAVVIIVLACVGLGAPWSYRHAAHNTAYAITNQEGADRAHQHVRRGRGPCGSRSIAETAHDVLWRWSGW